MKTVMRQTRQTSTSAPLDSWSGHDWSDGIQVDDLHALDCLTVRTRNSLYQIVVNDPESGEIMVRGGERLPVFTRARLCGSTVGGTVLKRGGIYPGFRLELELEGRRRILTSAVVSVDVDPHGTEQ